MSTRKSVNSAKSSKAKSSGVRGPTYSSRTNDKPEPKPIPVAKQPSIKPVAVDFICQELCRFFVSSAKQDISMIPEILLRFALSFFLV